MAGNMGDSPTFGTGVLQGGLHPLPKRGVNNRLVLSVINFILVFDFANINRVGNNLVNRPARHRFAAPLPLPFQLC